MRIAADTLLIGFFRVHVEIETEQRHIPWIKLFRVMASKSEISWKRRGEEGERIEVYAHKAGNRWQFFVRSKRFEQWQPLENPPLEDWVELLDAIRRRIGRRLVRPEEEERVRQMILERFPEAQV